MMGAQRTKFNRVHVSISTAAASDADAQDDSVANDFPRPKPDIVNAEFGAVG